LKNLLIIFSILGLAVTTGFGQTEVDSAKLIQFSGVVVHELEDEILPLPYTNIYIKGTNRGTSTHLDGFFSLVAYEGDTVIFSRIGYETIEFEIPDTLSTQHYSLVQIMTTGDYILPETVIYPWPSREHFDIEFLALDVSDEIRRSVEENLASEAMEQLRRNMPADGSEATTMYLRQTAQSYYYNGQFKPQNIFNPVAWKKFIDAWKRGDYKKKDKK
jgi:hypothetical protein